MDRNCTVYRTSEFVSKRWTIPILLELYKGDSCSKRYSEIKSSITGITPKILSARLKELEAYNMITKRVDAETFPVRCEYELTESGREFIRIIKSMKSWALKWNISNRRCAASDCKSCKL